MSTPTFVTESAVFAHHKFFAKSEILMCYFWSHEGFYRQFYLPCVGSTCSDLLELSQGQRLLSERAVLNSYIWCKNIFMHLVVRVFLQHLAGYLLKHQCLLLRHINGAIKVLYMLKWLIAVYWHSFLCCFPKEDGWNAAGVAAIHLVSGEFQRNNIFHCQD